MSNTDSASIENILVDIQRGQPVQAERAARQRLAVHHDEPQALVLLAVALGMQQRVDEALSIYRQLTAIEPAVAAHWSNLATAQRQSGEFKEADENYRHALRLTPDDPVLLSNLGVLCWQLGDVQETRELMARAYQLDPGLPEPRIYGAMACYECAETRQAEVFLTGHQTWPSLDPILEADLATALTQLGAVDAAEQRLRRVLRDQPGDGNVVRTALAALLERVNRVDEAEAILDSSGHGGEQAYDTEPTVRAALAARKGRIDEAAELYSKYLHSRGEESHVAEANHWFALAKVEDRRGHLDEAMAALRQAHAIQLEHALRLEPGLAADDTEPLDITKFPVPEESIARWHHEQDVAPASESPIFVVGFPRSGTTLVEQMLDACPANRSMDERAFLQETITLLQQRGFKYPDDLWILPDAVCESLRQEYWARVSGVVRVRGGEQLVDKNPLNMLRLPMIYRLWPNARIVLMLRHPCDVVLSNYMQNFRAPRFRIMCGSLSRLARSYARAMEFMDRQLGQLRQSVHTIRYEDMVGDFTGHASRLAAFLDMPDSSALENYRAHAQSKGFISTPSYAQVVEPLNDKGIGRWKRYRSYMEPVLPLLQPILDRWGYTLD